MTTVAVHSDDEARRLISEAIDDTLVVEASAGTGKTTELVNRILRVIAEGRADVREIVAVTFTEKAAGELKLRLRQQLELERRRATDPAASQRLADAVRHLEEAHVSTIHGFCADLLRERPVEARIDPLFRVLTEGQAERLFNEAFTSWFQRQLDHPPEGVRRSLRRGSRAFRPGEIDDDGPIERLRRAGFDLTEWRDFPAAWRRPLFDRAGDAARLVELVHACAAITARPSYIRDNLYVDTEPIRRLSRVWGQAPTPDPTQGVRPHESIRVRGSDPDLDSLEAQLIELRRNRDVKRARKGSGPGYSKGVTRAQVLEARDALLGALGDFQMRADADLAALLHEELGGCVREYERLKAREGAMDFLDLLLRARDLVQEDGVVRRHFQSRFKRIFVDEFQDTDPLQAELLLLLSADDPGETRWQHVNPERGKLFIVGDPKQSIYRFRRAEVATYLRVCELLEAAGARRVELRRSFRSVPSMQQAVNAAFAPVMNGDPHRLQASYVPLEPARDDHPAQPSLVALPVPEPYGQRYVSAKEIERSLPDAVGAYIDWLVRESGWTVTERREPGRRVPLEARHVCILFRRFVSYGEDVTRPYVEALEARGIRHLLVGGRAFHDREEIETLRAALMAIEWPDDQLSVFATLRGALFAIGDEELLEYFHLTRRFHPFRMPETLPSHLEPVRDALLVLRSMHQRRNRQPVADTISTLLERTRAHAGFVLRPGGEQALANVLHVAELARQYELDGGMSFRGFVDTLHEEATRGHAAEAPILEEGSDGVRLMTVHKAKGLEFPVVVLADITARLAPFEAGRHIDTDRGLCALRIGGWSPADLHDNRDTELGREAAEGERVAYVAATRARDLLVVPAVGDMPYEGSWVAPLNAAIYPAEDVRRAQSAARGCPLFKSKDSVLKRPDNDPATKLTVCPGEHQIGEPDDGFRVVWWAPDALSLGAQAPFGLRRDDLIVKDVPPATLRTHLETYKAWESSRAGAIAAASRPSVEVLTATEWALESEVAGRGSTPRQAGREGPPYGPDDVEVTVESAVTVRSSADGVPRPGGARFGSLVHALLADVPLGAVDERMVSGLAVAHGRVLGADPAEVAAAGAIVRTVMAHPILRAAADAERAGRCCRETPVTWRLDTGCVVEGIVDLAFTAGDEIVVVDFKTDRELDGPSTSLGAGAIDRDRRQVQLYAAAIGAALGRPARGVLMRV
jgi:ATP-dependent exoDNAse (exonuclease V) beta subunit